MRTRDPIGLMVLASFLLFAACGDGKESGPGAPPAPEAGSAASAAEAPAAGGEAPEPGAAVAPAPDVSEGAMVKGKVSFEGTPPKNKKIEMEDADPKCHELHKDQEVFLEEVVVNGNGTLRNVFVYVKKGLNGHTFPAPKEPVVIDQKGCVYHPHVFGVQVGQPIEILNSDPVLHNIHSYAKKSKNFNDGQAPGQPKITRTFSSKEIMVPIKCDVHKWMSTYVGVLDHPYFAVTGEDGTWAFPEGLPPGDYEITAWHEKYPAQTQKITVAAKETKELNFTFKAE